MEFGSRSLWNCLHYDVINIFVLLLFFFFYMHVHMQFFFTIRSALLSGEILYCPSCCLLHILHKFVECNVVLHMHREFGAIVNVTVSAGQYILVSS